jgi:serine/threonine protein kinase
MVTKKHRKTYRVNGEHREISKNTTKKYKGGKVIASGGFGCIFKPVLKCKSTTKRETDKISKLMVVKDAKEEYDDIMKFKPELEQIPNYENYFLIDGVNMCIPDKLTKQDLSQFNKNCKALKKEGYTEENINGRLKRIRALNMPDGGIDVGDFIEENDKNMKKWELLNETLVDLLLNGIIPMNNYHIFHCDIKDSNVLVDKNIENNKINTRLIDWGLSTYYIPFTNNSIFNCLLRNYFNLIQ